MVPLLQLVLSLLPHSSGIKNGVSRFVLGRVKKAQAILGSPKRWIGMGMRYVLRVFVSAKHMTAKVVEGNNGREVASASSVEHALRSAFEWGKGCDARAAASVGEVLAMRLKTEAPEVGVGGGVHFNVEKEIKKKSVDNGDKVWTVVNALRKRGIKVFVTDDHS